VLSLKAWRRSAATTTDPYFSGYCYLDKTGKIVFKVAVDSAGSFSEGLAPVVKNHKSGYIDSTGRIVIEPQFDNAQLFHEGLAAAQVGKLWGYIDKTGSWIIKPPV
jgi:hypothetical protein